MGNKISLGKCVIYCGFSGQRKKTKRKEEEKRREKEELERYEIWLKAEKFKADFPEYCIKAGIAPSSVVASVQQSQGTSEEGRRSKVHFASTVKASAPKQEPLNLRTADEITSSSRDCCLESPAKLTKPDNDLRSVEKIKPQNNQIVTVSSLYKNNEKKKNSGQNSADSMMNKFDVSQNTLASSNPEDPKTPRIVGLDLTTQSKDAKSTTHSEGSKVEDTTSNIMRCSVDVSHFERSPSMPSPHNNSNPQNSSMKDKSESKIRSTIESIKVIEKNPSVAESSVNSNNEPSSNMASLSIQEFNPLFNSTLKPIPSLPDESTRSKPSSLRKPPPPVPRDISSIFSSPAPSLPDESTRSKPSSLRQPPPPVPRDISSIFSSPAPSLPDESTRSKPSSLRHPPQPVPRDISSLFSSPAPSVCRGPSRSVTFNTTSSSDDFLECFSPSSSSDTMVSLKKYRPFVSEKVSETKDPGNNKSRERVKIKPLKKQAKRAVSRSFKWNGQCVYDSGYPCLMVGDRIESESEDDEFYQQRFTNVIPTPPVKHYAFGHNNHDNLHKHNLISARELYRDFNKGEVDVYLRERLEQFKTWNFGVGANIIGKNQYPTNMQGIKNTSNAAIVPLGSETTSHSTSLSFPDTLRNLHEELKELRNESKVLRTGLPRIINSIERRQRVLEARVDVLASRDLFMAFQEAGDENLKKKLKALHADLKLSKYESTQKRNMALKFQEDVFVEDIEDETRSCSRGNDKEQGHLEPVCDPEFQHRSAADDHDLMPKPSKEYSREQPTNESNTIQTNADTRNIKSKSEKYNQTQNESNIQAKDFAVEAKKVICRGQNPDIARSVVAKHTSTKQRDKTNHNRNHVNDVSVGRKTTLNTTGKYPKLSSSKDKNSLMMQNDISRKTSLKQSVISKEKNCDNRISDVDPVAKYPVGKDIELSPEHQHNDILEKNNIPIEKDLESANALIIQQSPEDPKSDKSNSKILSTENVRQSNNKGTSGDVDKALLPSAQSPTELMGAIDQKAISDETRESAEKVGVIKRQDSNEGIGLSSKDVKTQSFQDKLNIESATDLERRSVSKDEQNKIQKASNCDVDGSLLLSKNQNVNSSSMLTKNNSSDSRNITTHIPPDAMLTKKDYSNEIVNIEVAGTTDVAKNKLDFSLKEMTTPHSLRYGGNKLVERTIHQQPSQLSKLSPSSDEVVPRIAEDMINMKTERNIESGIKSGITPGEVVSKLHKDPRSPEAILSNQLFSDRKEEITFNTEVVGTANVARNKLDISLKEMATPHLLKCEGDKLVERTIPQQPSERSKVSPSSDKVIPSKAEDVINMKTERNVESGIKSEITSGEVVSKLRKDPGSPKAMQSSQLVSDRKEGITFLGGGLDGKTESKPEVILGSSEKYASAVNEHLDHETKVEEIYGKWKLAQDNFDNSGMELEAQNVEVTGQEHDGVIDNEVLKTVISCHDFDREAAEMPQPKVLTHKDVIQNVLEHGNKCETNLKPIQFELGRSKAGFDNGNLVFRNDIWKMKKPEDSQFSGSSRDQNVSVTEGIASDEHGMSPSSQEDETRKVILKEMLNDDFEQNVENTQVKVATSHNVYNEVINENKPNSTMMLEGTVQRNKILEKRIKKKNVYYEIGNFDKIIEEMLDSGFKNVDYRGSDSNVGKYMQGSMMPGNQNGNCSAKQEDHKTTLVSKHEVGKEADSKGEINTEDMLCALLSGEYSQDGSSIQIDQPSIGPESIFNLENRFKPTLDEKSKFNLHKKVSCQDGTVNMEQDFADVQSQVVEGQRPSTANVSSLPWDSDIQSNLKTHAFEFRSNSVKDVKQEFLGKELRDFEHEIFGQQNQQDQESVYGRLRRRTKDLLDKKDFAQEEYEFMPPKTDSLHPNTAVTNPRVWSLPSIATSSLKESTSQDDSTTSSSEKKTSERNNPNLVIPDMDTTNSERLSSPEPSLQEGVISGETDFKKTIEKYILPETSSNDGWNNPLSIHSSFIERASPFHETLKLITKTSERNVPFEDKSGYISEADFDTSFSDNLSYVEEDIDAVEVKSATTEETDAIENNVRVKNTCIFDNTIFKENVSNSEAPFEPKTEAGLWLSPSVSSEELSSEYVNVASLESQDVQVTTGKSGDRNSLDVERILQHKAGLTHSGVFETNPEHGSNIITGGTKSLPNVKSNLPGTEMHEIRNQKNFHGVIFRNFGIVPVTPTSTAQNLCDVGISEVKDKVVPQGKHPEKSNFGPFDVFDSKQSPYFDRQTEEEIAKIDGKTPQCQQVFPSDDLKLQLHSNMDEEESHPLIKSSGTEINDGRQKDITLKDDFVLQSKDSFFSEVDNPNKNEESGGKSFKRSTSKHEVKNTDTDFSESVIQEGNFHRKMRGGVNLERSMEKSVLPRSNNSCSRDNCMPLPDHSSERNVFPENKSGYIAKAEFDTSMSDDLPYVGDDLAESTGEPAAKHVERMENKYCMKNINALVGTMFSGNVASDATGHSEHETEAKSCLIPKDSKNKLSAYKHFHDSCNRIQRKVGAEITPSTSIERLDSSGLLEVEKCSQHNALMQAETNPTEEFGIIIHGTEEKSRALGNSTLQGSSEKNISDVVVTTANNDKLGENLRISAKETRPGEDLEQPLDQLLNSKPSSYQKMLREKSESDCGEFQNEINGSYNNLSDNNKDRIPGTNELSSRYSQVTPSPNKVILEDKDACWRYMQISETEHDASLSYKEATSSSEEISLQRNEMTADNFAKETVRLTGRKNEDISGSEDAFQEEMRGEIHFQETVGKDIFTKAKNSFDGYKNMNLQNHSSHDEKTFPSHENIKTTSSILERNVSPENKSGYISEADFDTSFSDNLSYVEENVVGVKRAGTEELEGKEEKRCVTNIRALDEHISSDNNEFGHGTNTNQTQSLANVQTTLQETEMPLIRSEQKSFEKIIFGNVDVVSITPSKEISSCDVRTSKVNDFAHEKNSGQNVGDIGSLSINSKHSWNQMMLNGTLEPHCDNSFSSRNEVTPSYDKLTNSSKDVRPGTNELNSFYTSRYSNITPRYNDVITPSCKRLAPEKDEFTDGNVQVTAKIKNDILDQNNSIGGRQDISLEDSEGEDIIPAVEYKLRQYLSERKIATSEVNNFRRQDVTSADDLKLQLYSDKEQELIKQAIIESNTSENEMNNVRRQNMTLESGSIFKTVVPYTSKEETCPEQEQIIERKSLFERKFSNEKIENNVRQNIALRDDFVLASDESLSMSGNILSNKTDDVSEAVFLESSISEDDIKKSGRRQIGLEDDFRLPSEDPFCEERNNNSNAKNEEIASEEKFPNLYSKYLEREDIYFNKDKEFCRQTLDDRDYYEDSNDALNRASILKQDRVNHPSSSKHGDLKKEKREREIEHADEHLIDDPDYRLNTLSDISSISDDMSPGAKFSNIYNENVIQQTNHYHGINENKLSTNQMDNSTHLNNSEDRNEKVENPKTVEDRMTSALAVLFAEMGLLNYRKPNVPETPETIFTPSPPPKRTGPDPNSHAMTQLRNIMRGTKPSNAARQVATQKTLQKELERHLKERDEKIFESKERGTRCLEKFRDNLILKPRTASPRKQVSYPGLGAALYNPPKNPRLQSRSLSGIGFGSHFEERGQNDATMYNPVQYHVNRSSFSNMQHVQPAYEPRPQLSDDEDSYLNEILLQQDSHEDIGLARSGTFCGGDQNNIGQKSSTSFNRGSNMQTSSLNFNSAPAEPAYRTPDCRRPAALVPLNVGKSAPNLASKVASFQAASGFGPSDPWKPKPLPGIMQEGLSPRRSDSWLKQKPLPVPSLATPMKPPVLPGIAGRPLQRRPLPAIIPDRAL